MTLLKELFEISKIVEGTWASPRTENSARALIKLLQHPLPASASTEALYNLMGDDRLFDMLDEVKDKDPTADVRSIVIDKLKEWLSGAMQEWHPEWDQKAIHLLTNFLNSAH